MIKKQVTLTYTISAFTKRRDVHKDRWGYGKTSISNIVAPNHYAPLGTFSSQEKQLLFVRDCTPK